MLSVPPASFGALSRAELRQLRELLNKVAAADPAFSGEGTAGRRYSRRLGPRSSGVCRWVASAVSLRGRFRESRSG